MMTHYLFAAVLAVSPAASAGQVPGLPAVPPASSSQGSSPPPASPGTRAGVPLTVEAAVSVALDGHPSIRAAEMGIVAAREQVGQRRAAYYPDLVANAGYSRWERHAFLPEGISSPSLASSIGPTNDWFAGLSGRLLLYDSGERAARVRSALAGERTASAEAGQLRQDLVLRVHESFNGFVAAVQARDVAGQEQARTQEHLRIAEARKAAGAVPGGDVVRARVGVSEARLHVVSADHVVRVAAGRLATAMGLPPETPLNVAPQDAALAPPPAVRLEASMSRALEERPVLAAGRSGIEAARGALDAARSQFGPRLSTDWRFGWRDSAWLPEDRDWSVGVAVQWTLFDGGARRRSRAQAQAELSRAEAALSGRQLEVRQEVWAALSRLDESYEAARAAEDLVIAAEESLRVARERYQLGAGTLVDLLDADASLARAAAARVASLLDYRSSRATFQWATGGLGKD
jgi:outer membrane protein TolC